MFCPKCGAEQDEGCRYCTACGQEIASVQRGSVAKAASPNRRRRAIIAVCAVAAVAFIATAVVVCATMFNQGDQVRPPQLAGRPLAELFSADSAAAAEMLEQAFKNEGIDNNSKEFTCEDAKVQELEGYDDYRSSLCLYDGDRQSLSISLLKSGATLECAEATTFYFTDAAPLDSLKNVAVQEGFPAESLAYYEDDHKTLLAFVEDGGLVLWASVSDLSQGVQRMVCKWARSGSAFAQELRAEWEDGAQESNASKEELDQKREYEESVAGKQQAAQDAQTVDKAQGTTGIDLLSVEKGDPEAGAGFVANRTELLDDYGTPYFVAGSQEDAARLLHLDYEAIEAPFTASLVNATSNGNILGLSADEIAQGAAKSATVRMVQIPNSDDPLVFAKSIIESYGFPSGEAVVIDCSGTLMTSCTSDNVVLYTTAAPLHNGLYDVSVTAFAPESMNLDPYRNNFRMAFNDGVQLQ